MAEAQQRTVVFAMTPAEARAVWHALGTFVELYDQVEAHDGVPSHAPMHGKRDVIAASARRLDHEINHAPGGRCAGH